MILYEHELMKELAMIEKKGFWRVLREGAKGTRYGEKFQQKVKDLSEDEWTELWDTLTKMGFFKKSFVDGKAVFQITSKGLKAVDWLIQFLRIVLEMEDVGVSRLPIFNVSPIISKNPIYVISDYETRSSSYEGKSKHTKNKKELPKSKGYNEVFIRALDDAPHALEDK